MHITRKLTFDDVQLVPKYSEIPTRDICSTLTKLTRNYTIPIPIIAAPMDTVCGWQMVVAMLQYGAAGALHRFMSISDMSNDITAIFSKTHTIPRQLPIIASIGATGLYKERAETAVAVGANILLIDVAHGDHLHVKNAMEWINRQSWRSNVDIIAGNVATADSAIRLEDWGADAIRVGIGGGSMCTTRINTGVGIPQLSAVHDVVQVTTVPVISDGGIRYPGDAAKALAAGADTVMVGGLLAGTVESPGEILTMGHWPNEVKLKTFRGSASSDAKRDTGDAIKHVEGASRTVELKGPVTAVLDRLMDGIRSAMSYSGAKTLAEFRQNAEFIQITTAGLFEAHPHGLK